MHDLKKDMTPEKSLLLDLIITCRIAEFVSRKRFRASSPRRVLEFFNSCLEAEERAFLLGGFQGADAAARDRHVLALLRPRLSEAAARMKAGKGPFPAGDPNLEIVKRIPWPLRLAAEGETSAEGETAPVTRPRGDLFLGDIAIGRAEILARNNRAELKVTGPLPSVSAVNLFRAMTVDVFVEVARKEMPAAEISSLGEGSRIRFDTGFPFSVRLVIAENDLTIAAGDAVCTRDRLGIIITSLHTAAEMDRARNERLSAGPCVRLLFGKTRVLGEDILGLCPGQVIELDQGALDRPLLRLDDGYEVPCETSVENGRITAGLDRQAVTGEPSGTLVEDGVLPEAPFPGNGPEEYRLLLAREIADLKKRNIPAAVLLEEILRDLKKRPDVLAGCLGAWMRDSEQEAGSFLVLIGKAPAASVISLLPENDVAVAARAMASAEVILPSRADDLCFKAGARIRAHAKIARGGPEYARSVVEAALGKEAVERLAIEHTLAPEKEGDPLKDADPSLVLDVIRGEHPQTIAMILSAMDTIRASLLLSGLDFAVRADIVRRIALTGPVPGEVFQAARQALAGRLTVIGDMAFVFPGGIDAAVELLNNVDRGTEKVIIEFLEEQDRELAEAIKSRMFVFEDIVLLDDRSIQKVLREVDTQDLAKALKAVDSDVQEKIFRNMSRRAGALLREDMDFMGPIRLRDVEESQQKVLWIIRKLEDSGDIIIARAGEEELVV